MEIDFNLFRQYVQNESTQEAINLLTKASKKEEYQQFLDIAAREGSISLIAAIVAYVKAKKHPLPDYKTTFEHILNPSETQEIPENLVDVLTTLKEKLCGQDSGVTNASATIRTQISNALASTKLSAAYKKELIKTLEDGDMATTLLHCLWVAAKNGKTNIVSEFQKANYPMTSALRKIITSKSTKLFPLDQKPLIAQCLVKHGASLIESEDEEEAVIVTAAKTFDLDSLNKLINCYPPYDLAKLLNQNNIYLIASVMAGTSPQKLEVAKFLLNQGFAYEEALEKCTLGSPESGLFTTINNLFNLVSQQKVELNQVMLLTLALEDGLWEKLRNDEGNTILHLAVSSADPITLQQLLSMLTDPQKLYAKNDQGLTPIDILDQLISPDSMTFIPFAEANKQVIISYQQQQAFLLLQAALARRSRTLSASSQQGPTFVEQPSSMNQSVSHEPNGAPVQEASQPRAALLNGSLSHSTTFFSTRRFKQKAGWGTISTRQLKAAQPSNDLSTSTIINGTGNNHV
ncbi:MAG: hypothetical protein AB7F64_01725 [Gammaproteobacteria bacterium]